MSDEAPAAAPKKIQLTVHFGAGGEETAFSVKPTTPFSKVYDNVAKIKGLIIDGHVLRDEETPKMLELDDDTMVEYHLQQVGGRS